MAVVKLLWWRFVAPTLVPNDNLDFLSSHDILLSDVLSWYKQYIASHDASHDETTRCTLEVEHFIPGPFFRRLNYC